MIPLPLARCYGMVWAWQDGGGAPVLLFDASKRETHHRASGFKKLFQRVRANFKCELYVGVWGRGGRAHVSTRRERGGGVPIIVLID